MQYNFKTYKYYNVREERLTIYGEIIDPNTIKITVLRCSKKDKFIKKLADSEADKFFTDGKPITNAIDDFNEGMSQFTIPIKNGEPKNTFLRFCRDNYFMLIPSQPRPLGQFIHKLLLNGFTKL